MKSGERVSNAWEICRVAGETQEAVDHVFKLLSSGSDWSDMEREQIEYVLRLLSGIQTKNNE